MLECTVCCSEIPEREKHFKCEVDNTILCLPCFGNFLNSCCDEYYFGKIPVHCAYCRKYEVPVATIKELAEDPILKGQGLWQKYEDAQLNTSLLKKNMKKGEIPVACPKCNLYIEIFPEDYYARVELLRSATKEIHKAEEKASSEKVAADTSTASKDDLDAIDLPQPPVVRRQSSRAEVHHFNPKEEAEMKLTSTFFKCGREECGYALCLSCGTLVPGKGMGNHLCQSSSEDQMYNKILHVLAEGSVMECPYCNDKFRKDLECTHMECACDGGEWCYVCGSELYEAGHDIEYACNTSREHANDSCYMYLQYRFGDTWDGDYNLNGDPALALVLFHIDRQRKLIEQMKSGFSKEQLETYEKVVAKRFPKGFWSERNLLLIEQADKLTDQLIAHNIVNRICSGAGIAISEFWKAYRRIPYVEGRVEISNKRIEDFEVKLKELMATRPVNNRNRIRRFELKKTLLLKRIREAKQFIKDADKDLAILSKIPKDKKEQLMREAAIYEKNTADLKELKPRIENSVAESSYEEIY